ncbi:MAG: hypothetical protein NDJ92_02005 [Thermoanaerobaculia bacterium]|nr:hypothetical protein [Thermoanaerobaculia bacterium]
MPRFVGFLKQVTQPDVAEYLLPGASAATVSRVLSEHEDFLIKERFNRTGENHFRLRPSAKQLLLDAGVPEDDVFVSPPIALSQLAHHRWMVRAWLVQKAAHPERIVEPAWRIQRRNAKTRHGMGALPDLLSFDPVSGRTIATEIDMGFESGIVVRKKAARVIEEIDVAGIILLSVGPRRILALERAFAADHLPVPVVVLPLPKSTGRQASRDLRSLFE